MQNVRFYSYLFVMNIKWIFSFIGILGFFSQTFAQDSDSRSELMIIQQVTEENQLEEIVKNNQSSVFLNQIGQFNEANIYSKSQSSSYSILQAGVNNNIYQYKIAKTLNEKMEQFGNNNRVFEIANNFVEKTDSNISQQGNNLRVEKYGNNEIGANLNIKMKGNSRTVIVRNYQ